MVRHFFVLRAKSEKYNIPGFPHSDHAPVVIDLDSPGSPFDAGWSSADSRIAARRS